MSSRYAELQVTSHFSFLRGASSCDELFAQAISRGESGRTAYRSAGFECSDAAADVGASRLLKTDKVSGRVAELSNRANAAEATVLTKVWVIEETIALAARAKAAGAYGPAAKCMELLAREVNAFVPKSEVGKPGDFSDLTDEDIIERINAIKSEIRGSRKAGRRAGQAPDPATLQ